MKSRNNEVLVALTHIVKGAARFSFSRQPARKTAGDADGPFAETRRRTRLLQELYRLYAVETPADDGATFYRDGLPPDGWVNDQLESRREGWRVHNIDGFRCEIFDAR